MDTRSPLVLNTRDLSRRPGSMRRLQRVVPAPDGLGVELVGVPAGSDLHLDLRLEAVMEGVLVSGEVRAVVEGECGRCLGPLTRDLVAEVQELFAYPGHEMPQGEDEDAEPLPVLEGDVLDLEPTVRDALVTALPFQPLCTPDCPGLCPECGARLAEVGPDHVHTSLDPRWAALRGLAPGDGADDGAGRLEEPP